MLKVLIAVDGSSHARKTIDAVAQLSKSTGEVEAVLLNVRDHPPYYGELPPFDMDSLENLLKRRQDDVLQAALNEAKANGLEHVTTQRAMGDVSHEIVRVANELDVNEIAMGTHGRSAMGSFFMGSVAQRVVHLSKVPVLLVK